LTSKLRTNPQTNPQNSTLCDNKGPLKLSAREPIYIHTVHSDRYDRKCLSEDIAVNLQKLITDTAIKSTDNGTERLLPEESNTEAVVNSQHSPTV